MSRTHYNTDKGIPVRRADGRIIGSVHENKFVKHACGSLHMLREPRGWALDSDSLADAERLGAKEVEIVDVETDITYSASIERIRRKGFGFDRGHGHQIALPLKHWSIRRPGEAEQLAFALA